MRWVVLETPRPEELIVAAAKLELSSGSESGSGVGIVRELCFDPEAFGSGPDQISTLLELLLRILMGKLEAICSSFGLSRVRIRLPAEDEEEWVLRIANDIMGYREVGGGLEEQGQGHGFGRSVMIMDLEKSIRTTSEAFSSSNSSNNNNSNYYGHTINCGEGNEDNSGIGDEMNSINIDVDAQMQLELELGLEGMQVEDITDLVMSESGQLPGAEGEQGLAPFATAIAAALNGGGSNQEPGLEFELVDGAIDMLANVINDAVSSTTISTSSMTHGHGTNQDPMLRLLPELFQALHNEMGDEL